MREEDKEDEDECAEEGLRHLFSFLFSLFFSFSALLFTHSFLAKSLPRLTDHQRPFPRSCPNNSSQVLLITP